MYCEFWNGFHSKASGAVPVFKAANVVGPGETLALESESLRSKPLVNYQPGLFTSRRRSMSAHSCIRALNQALTPQQSRSAEQMRRCQIVPRAGCGLGGWACARSKPLSDGGDLSSDGALILLRRSDQHIGLSRAAAAAYGDARDPRRIEHRLRDLLAQRIYAICCGYEDLNDQDVLRGDPLMQTAVGRDAPLASSPISVGWRT